MSNCAYLYSLSNRPTSYADRPETITGLSQWAYYVPFSYRVLMSGDARICPSFISDGFEDDPPSNKTRLYAISSEYDSGFRRLKQFIAFLGPIAASSAPSMVPQLNETIAFLESHRDRYLLLETIEIDTMLYGGEDELRDCVEAEAKNCRDVGLAIDALVASPSDPSMLLFEATQRKLDGPLEALFGLRLDDDFDNIRDDKTTYPIGLEWSNVLYYTLMNRAEFEKDG